MQKIPTKTTSNHHTEHLYNSTQNTVNQQNIHKNMHKNPQNFDTTQYIIRCATEI